MQICPMIHETLTRMLVYTVYALVSMGYAPTTCVRPRSLYIYISGQIIIFHQPRFPWNKGISLIQLPFGVRSCEVAILLPDIYIYIYQLYIRSNGNSSARSVSISGGWKRLSSTHKIAQDQGLRRREPPRICDVITWPRLNHQATSSTLPWFQ